LRSPLESCRRCSLSSSFASWASVFAYCMTSSFRTASRIISSFKSRSFITALNVPHLYSFSPVVGLRNWVGHRRRLRIGHEHTSAPDRLGHLAGVARGDARRLALRPGRHASLADDRVPVNAEIDVSAVDIPDYRLGTRGVSDIGTTGTGAAVANATPDQQLRATIRRRGSGARPPRGLRAWWCRPSPRRRPRFRAAGAA
jgi:hypothetical protein